MFDIFKKPITLVILFVAILIALGWSYYEKWNENRKKQEAVEEINDREIADLTNVDASEFDSVVKDEYAKANDIAVKANPNNILRAIVVDLPSTEINSGDTRYIFANKDDTDNNFVITFSQSSGNYMRATIPINDYLGSLIELNTKLWKFNYVTALQIAEENGGLDFRNNNDIGNINIILKHDFENNWLIWSVSYMSTQQNSLVINIDANSGQIIKD